MQLNLGTKIRKLRHRDGRTQEAVAEVLGVTSQAVPVGSQVAAIQTWK